MTQPDVMVWLHAKANYIEGRLNTHRINLNYEIVSPQLLLSDLQLCGAIESMEEPPKYTRTQKRVTNHELGITRTHRYYESTESKGGSQTIIDYLFGQFFIIDENDGVSGVCQAISRSPDLIIRLTNQVYVLYGSRSLILEKLRISYWLSRHFKYMWSLYRPIFDLSFPFLFAQTIKVNEFQLRHVGLTNPINPTTPPRVCQSCSFDYYHDSNHSSNPTLRLFE